MAVSSFVPVSLDPPLLAVSIRRDSRTWPLLRRSRGIGVSVLAAGHGPLSRRLAGPVDRFAGVDWTAAPSGAVRIGGAAAWFDCAPAEEVPAGDHVIALLAVRRVEYGRAVPPLVFHGSAFRELAPEAPVRTPPGRACIDAGRRVARRYRLWRSADRHVDDVHDAAVAAPRQDHGVDGPGRVERDRVGGEDPERAPAGGAVGVVAAGDGQQRGVADRGGRGPVAEDQRDVLDRAVGVDHVGGAGGRAVRGQAEERDAAG
ncbi:flavin reductase family protein [Catenuloplanes atrovinosus]|uniref:flavin reductase family protein n=1 Tax=Catenuloplanes atrovinosus TaxID=137266 RepID=UPI00286BE06E|nr:flavin reductase family protein [Catenuloplanes atrovinosus]